MKDINRKIKEIGKRKLVILFAEDNKIVREIMSRALNEYFETVYIAEDGDQAIDILNKKYIDILVTDINMPSSSGLDVIMHARKMHEVLPIIITTALTEFNMYNQFDNINVIEKPYSIIEIIEVVESLLCDVELHRKTKNALDELENIYSEAQRVLDLINECDICTSRNEEYDKIID